MSGDGSLVPALGSCGGKQCVLCKCTIIFVGTFSNSGSMEGSQA